MPRRSVWSLAQGSISRLAFEGGSSDEGSSSVADSAADSSESLSKTHVPRTGEHVFSTVSDGSAGASSEGKTSSPTSGSVPLTSQGSQKGANSTSGSIGGTVTASADLQGWATIGVTWSQQDMKDPSKAPQLRIRYLKNGVWSEWTQLSSYDDDTGVMGVSVPYYVGQGDERRSRADGRFGSEHHLRQPGDGRSGVFTGGDDLILQYRFIERSFRGSCFVDFIIRFDVFRGGESRHRNHTYP